MINKSELSFLIDVLAKIRIGASVVSPSSKEIEKITNAVCPFIGRSYKTVGDYLGEISEGVVYKRHENNGVEVIYMVLPESDGDSVLLIGPYTTVKHTQKDTLEEAERIGLPVVLHRAFSNYLTSLPYVSEESAVFALVDVFAKRLYPDTDYTVKEINSKESDESVLRNLNRDAESNDRAVLTSMRVMEERYRFENELIRLVSEGQSAKAEMLLSTISEEMFESRHKDALRNIKNYSIVTNTLLRKAVEKGGVHPVNIDRISSHYAMSIEACRTVSECLDLIRGMFKEYCKLVGKYSLRDVSPIVQKAVFLIDNDPAQDISLSSLAEMTNVSPGYLSAIFKREMKKTVTDYITDKRIAHASYLLSSTHLQIQTVASHCGILDVQYFSKIFKKKTGLTPREYREKYKNAN